MSNLKRAIFWVALYLLVIFIMGELDYSDTPLIDFAKYFYYLALVVIPATLFFPKISKIHVAIPAAVWAVIYLLVYHFVDRTESSPHTTFAIVLLEFLLIELGFWLSYQLAWGIGHAESIMDAMALAAFPNRTMEIKDAHHIIKTEITRSRRYHRSLSLLVLQSDADNPEAIKNLIKTIQHDLWDRFSFARVGKIIDEHIRQTDIVFRDRGNRYLILCPETDSASSEVLAKRIAQEVKSKTDLNVYWGVASFPNDALNFDDLLDAASTKLAHSPEAHIENGHLKFSDVAENKAHD